MSQDLLVKKPAAGGAPPAGGGAAAPVGAGAAAAATVTPVLTASATGIDDRPGTIPESVEMGQFPRGAGPAPPAAAVGIEPMNGNPGGHPGGGCCIWVT